MFSSFDGVPRSILLFGNVVFLEGLYSAYASGSFIDQEWRYFFSNLDVGTNEGEVRGAASSNGVSLLSGVCDIGGSVLSEEKGGNIVYAPSNGVYRGESQLGISVDDSENLFLLFCDRLGFFFRTYGHKYASLDPLSGECNFLQRTGSGGNLISDAIKYCDSKLYDELLRSPVYGDRLQGFLERMLSIYAGNIGYEFMHVDNLDAINWCMDKLENLDVVDELSDKLREDILRDLVIAETFEKFLHEMYPGYKRFSLEGCESMLVFAEAILGFLPAFGVKELIVGMAHRGRLNFLTKVVGKSYSDVLFEFSGGSVYNEGVDGVSGDVKYHLGCSVDRVLGNGDKIRVSVCYNPSHLEAVNSVAMGRTKAKQLELGGDAVSCLLIHGDASFPGQGVVTESMLLSGLDSYNVGGVIHLIVNNQVGFTADKSKTCSGNHCSDLAKSFGFPVFHVNADDPEAVYKVAKLAVDYRSRYKSDVFVDLVCYRRHGHNEGDEPRFTQPLMYRSIDSHPTVVSLYSKHLESSGICNGLAEKFNAELRKELSDAFKNADSFKAGDVDCFEECWTGFRRAKINDFGEYYPSKTGLSGSKLRRYSNVITSFLEVNGTNLHPKTRQVLENRAKGMKSGVGIDWGTGESISIMSLLEDGYSVRLSGQDSVRGTFSHRHAKPVDQNTGEFLDIINDFGKFSGRFDVFNSPLSEYGVMGFEYGYSTCSPNSLVLWEGQFGDFANGAQVIIDQFVSSAESKWLRCTGLVLLLPHGCEGQGPEHTSARLERFLQLFADDNMQIVNCTTPANYCHVLRRQMLRDFRKPLVVMTPKYLLRYKSAVSIAKDFEGSFRPVIHDSAAVPGRVSRLILCSGKVYYDLIAAREAGGLLGEVAIVRVEQLAPFPTDLVRREISLYSGSVSKIIWCQEECENMGAQFFVIPKILEILNELKVDTSKLITVARPASASPAVGSPSVHSKQQSDLLKSALGS